MPGTSPVGEKKKSVATVLQPVPSVYKLCSRILKPFPQFNKSCPRINKPLNYYPPSMVGLCVGVGLGLGNQIEISTRRVIIWQGVENGHNTHVQEKLQMYCKTSKIE